ncbi:hypothetical protein Raf01_65080 [Rugosimonospora africana]|uniref:Uncharacterized protein n=1 Tax=Rugosimonospora africana TaxID=556532 RepID=A0A8J3R176_9ACTN|nr:hypothetical protein Raf01_65080 [Rugosimonospora africana]
MAELEFAFGHEVGQIMRNPEAPVETRQTDHQAVIAAHEHRVATNTVGAVEVNLHEFSMRASCNDSDRIIAI